MNNSITKDINNLIDELSKKINEKYNVYIIHFKTEDSIKIKVKQDINRPNNPDDFELIYNYIINNYGDIFFEIIEIDTIETVLI